MARYDIVKFAEVMFGIKLLPFQKELLRKYNSGASMEKIIINPHYCTKEEYAELINYLDNNSWDWKKVSEERIVEIEGKQVKYWYADSSVYLSEEERERVKVLLNDGYVQGELLAVAGENTIRGWWETEESN